MAGGVLTSFPLKYIRQQDEPIDVDSVFSNTSARISYLTNARRYPGQVVADLETQKLYLLNATKDSWIEQGVFDIDPNTIVFPADSLEQLSSLSHDDYHSVIVKSAGIFFALQSDAIPDEENTFSSSDSGWIWVRQMSEGDVDINRIGVINRSGNDFQFAHASLKVNNKFYIGTRNDTPGLLVYNNPDDLSDYTIIRSDISGMEAMCYDQINNRIYIPHDDTVIVLNPGDNSYSDETIVGADFGNSPGIATDGIYVYIATFKPVAAIVKIRISDWTIVQSANLLYGVNAHSLNLIQYTDGADLFITTLNGIFYKVNPEDLSQEPLFLDAAILTDDFVAIKKGATKAEGSICWVGSEDFNGTFKIDTSFMGVEAFFLESLPSYGIFTDGTFIYNTSLSGFIEKWPINSSDQKDIIRYYTHSIIPNEFLISDSGKFFITKWNADSGGIFEFEFIDITVSQPNIIEKRFLDAELSRKIHLFGKDFIRRVGSVTNFLNQRFLGKLSSGRWYSIDTNVHPDLYPLAPPLEVLIQTSSRISGTVSGFCLFYVPKYNKAISGFGIWNSAASSYSVGDKVVWGYRSWTNLTGLVGTSVDKYSLDSNWSADSFFGDDYRQVWHEVLYDIDRNMIIERCDPISGNRVRFDAQAVEILGDSNNSIRSFQWGNEYDSLLSKGIGNISIENDVFDNINFRGDKQQGIKRVGEVVGSIGYKYLAGSGTRMLVADADGNISTQSIPIGSGSSGDIQMFTVGDSSFPSPGSTWVSATLVNRKVLVYRNGAIQPQSVSSISSYIIKEYTSDTITFHPALNTEEEVIILIV